MAYTRQVFIASLAICLKTIKPTRNGNYKKVKQKLRIVNSAVQSTGSYRGVRFDSQHLHGSSQPSVTQSLGSTGALF